MLQKLNERVWAGQLISWIQIAISERRTIFQDATNDAGIKLESGRTKFPDILLFSDKISGIIFNGWELKFPDTAVDNREMLENALEKAKRLKSDSFVTWNGAEAIIWKINNDIYSVDSISKVKVYSKEKTINVREDLSDPRKYKINEPLLKERLNLILHDLEQLLLNGELKKAINISDNFIDAIKDASEVILPQFKAEIENLKGGNVKFRDEFNKWKIYESSTLKILASSSRKPTNLIQEEVLAKFTFYNLIGKIIFYLTLSENLSGSLQKLDIRVAENIKQVLETYFDAAQRIDYQAVFKPYFTDIIPFNETINETLFALFESITEFDFKILPPDVIGTILENLVPQEEKQKFGQYFTSSTLANLVSFPTIQTNTDSLFDPTSGTGTFLNSFYQILKYHGNTNHEELLNQIWGNDISHFPAILSVINLYKQKVNATDNFPRVIRGDYFNLTPNSTVIFPDPKDYKNQVEQRIPLFDGIASNFPFVQQEDIPNDILTTYFREKFELTQQAFLRNTTFRINERSDYFTYCIYNSIRFLKENGFISAITSNAWLGKEYGFQFKTFLLDNFRIKYVVKSNAEHWFSDSKVSTMFLVLEYTQKDDPIKFITLNFKLNEYFDQKNLSNQLAQIQNLYSDIDLCNDERNGNWFKDDLFENLYHRNDGLVDVSIVSKQKLRDSIPLQENWDPYFISDDIFEKIQDDLVILYPEVINSFRGERTGWNEMFIIKSAMVEESGIEEEFLIPYVKSPTELDVLEFEGDYKYYLFVCDKSKVELERNYPGANGWVEKFQNALNKNGTKTIQEAFKGNQPFWYSLRPKKANIVTAINPYERFFFSFSDEPFCIDQRLVGITVNGMYDIELIAALLNSIITLLTIEMRGTSRNLGVLDLNANYFKTLRILDPGKLSTQAKEEIKTAFQPLKKRIIENVFEEIKKQDRIYFDKTILRAFNIDESLQNGLYKIFLSTIYDRINMSEK